MSQFLVKPQGTYRGMVCARLLTPEGRRVECAEQWIHRDYDHKIWGRYVTDKAIEEHQYTGAKFDKDMDILEIKRQVKEEIKALRVKASILTKRWPTCLSIHIKSYSGQVGGPLMDGQGKLTDLAYQLHDDIEQIANAYNYDHSDP
jgi:hypothetical protein